LKSAVSSVIKINLNKICNDIFNAEIIVYLVLSKFLQNTKNVTKNCDVQLCMCSWANSSHLHRCSCRRHAAVVFDLYCWPTWNPAWKLKFYWNQKHRWRYYYKYTQDNRSKCIFDVLTEHRLDLIIS
jgi:hypothetical protein